MSLPRRLGVACLFALGASALFASTLEAARGCRIRIYGHTKYTGSVTNRGFSTFTRFAVTVNFQIQGPFLFSQTRRGPWVAGCPEDRQSVSITPDVPSSDPQMMLFLQEVDGQAFAASEGGRGDPIGAAYFELHSAARNLRGSIMRTGFTEIAIDAAWDVAQLVAPFSVSQQIVGSFVVELTKEWVKGGTGKDLKRWAQVNGASFLKSVGLDESNQQLLDAFIQIADRAEKVLNEKMEPIILTATGTAGECDVTLEATLDPRTSKAFVGFNKSCGDVDESTFLQTRVNPGRVAVEPGANGSFTATVIDRQTMSPVPITGGHSQGLAAVTDAGEATTNLAGGGLTFTFKAADIKKDEKYPVTLHVTTANGTPRPYTTDVEVLNVAPEVTSTPDTEKKKPGQFMSLNGNAVILDRNADNNNLNEVQASGVSTSGHPQGLDTARTEADLDDVDCSGPVNGVYTCQIIWNKGRVEKPHKHDTFTADLRVRDDDRAEGTGSLAFEVEDVVPEVISLTPAPRKFMEGDGLKVGVTAVVADDNGSDDIEDVELDASDAGGGKYPLTAFTYQANPAQRRLELTLTDPFPHIDKEGKYPITLKAMDGAPPDNLSTKNVTERISVGNFPPRLCASGILWETPQGVSRPLCPGQPFTIAVCVEDDEGNKLEVIARGAGQTVPLAPSPGTKNWVGTMYAPLEPGTYTFEVTMAETDTPTRKSIKEVIRIDVIDCSDQADVTWSAKVTPASVCPGDPFSVEPVAQIFEDSKMTVIHPDSRVRFQGQSANTDQLRPVARFTAPDKPGVYPIDVRSNVLGSTVDYGSSIKVDPCSDITDDIIELLVSPHACNLFDLGAARDPTVQLQMFETSESFLSLEYQTRPPQPAARGWEALRRVVERFSLTPSVHAAEPPAIFLKSLGNSTGEAFEAQVFSRGGPLPKLVGEGIVVEPLKKKAQERLQKELEKLTDKLPNLPLEGKLNAYCLEFLRRPPRPGQLFQLAPRELQEKFAPMRRILEASRRVEEAGLLSPDSDPAQYLHSIRQWAMWSEKQGFDEAQFGAAFLKRTRENLEGAGRTWTQEIEQAVQSLVPNRWKDIARVVREAEKGVSLPKE